MPKSGGDKQNDKNSEHNHSDFSPRNYLHILYHSLRLDKKIELNIMVDDIKPHIIGIIESWAHNDITDAELGLEGYVMFRKDRIGQKGGGVLLYSKDTIPAYEVQLRDEADCSEAICAT